MFLHSTANTTSSPFPTTAHLKMHVVVRPVSRLHAYGAPVHDPENTLNGCPGARRSQGDGAIASVGLDSEDAEHGTGRVGLPPNELEPVVGVLSCGSTRRRVYGGHRPPA